MNLVASMGLFLKKRPVRIVLLMAAALVLFISLLIFHANARVTRCARFVYATAFRNINPPHVFG